MVSYDLITDTVPPESPWPPTWLSQIYQFYLPPKSRGNPRPNADAHRSSACLAEQRLPTQVHVRKDSLVRHERILAIVAKMLSKISRFATLESNHPAAGPQQNLRPTCVQTTASSASQHGLMRRSVPPNSRNLVTQEWTRMETPRIARTMYSWSTRECELKCSDEVATKAQSPLRGDQDVLSVSSGGGDGGEGGVGGGGEGGGGDKSIVKVSIFTGEQSSRPRVP